MGCWNIMSWILRCVVVVGVKTAAAEVMTGFSTSCCIRGCFLSVKKHDVMFESLTCSSIKVFSFVWDVSFVCHSWDVFFPLRNESAGMIQASAIPSGQQVCNKQPLMSNLLTNWRVALKSEIGSAQKRASGENETWWSVCTWVIV